MGQTRLLFVYFWSTEMANKVYNLTIFGKNNVNVIGIRTRGFSIVGTPSLAGLLSKKIL